MLHRATDFDRSFGRTSAMENENTRKKLAVTSISHNNKVATDKHAVWERKHFTLYEVCSKRDRTF